MGQFFPNPTDSEKTAFQKSLKRSKFEYFFIFLKLSFLEDDEDRKKSCQHVPTTHAKSVPTVYHMTKNFKPGL